MAEVIYISGPMTGYPGFNYDTFRKAELYLKEHGKTVVSPVILEEEDTGMPWLPLYGPYEYYLKQSLVRLLQCNAICMLPGWQLSTGACLERELAVKLKYTIYETQYEAVGITE